MSLAIGVLLSWFAVHPLDALSIVLVTVAGLLVTPQFVTESTWNVALEVEHDMQKARLREKIAGYTQARFLIQFITIALGLVALILVLTSDSLYDRRLAYGGGCWGGAAAGLVFIWVSSKRETSLTEDLRRAERGTVFLPPLWTLERLAVKARRHPKPWLRLGALCLIVGTLLQFGQAVFGQVERHRQTTPPATSTHNAMNSTTRRN
jgi:hypothetical protein